MASKNTIWLWYDGAAEDAARFYAQTFSDSVVGAIHRAPSDYPSGKQGDVLTVEFTVMGIACLAVVADHATRPRRRDHRYGSRGSQARFRSDDADDQDRHRRD